MTLSTPARTRRRTVPASTAVGVAVLAALTAGCSDGGTASAAGDARSSTAASPVGSDAPSATPSGTAGAGTSTGAATGAAQPTGTKNVAACTMSAVRFSATAHRGSKDGNPATWIIITVRNTSGAACSVRGVPAVTIDGRAGGAESTCTAVPAAGTVQTVVLAANGSAGAYLQYLDGTDGSGNMTATGLTVGLTETGATQQVAWPAAAAIMCNDGATHPGTWVQPFVAS